MTRHCARGLVVGGALASLLTGSAPAHPVRAVAAPPDLVPVTTLPTDGRAVDISSNGRVAVVGTPSPGTVQIFARRGADWEEQVKLRSPPGESSFGAAVTLSTNGTTAVIGAPDTKSRGAAWVYTNRGGGTWVGKRLPATGVGKGAAFGSSLALAEDGRSIAVGGPGDEGGRGAVWTFRLKESAWKQFEKVTPSGAKGKARFGSSVALASTGYLMYVGGPADRAGRGAVWRLRRAGEAGWVSEAKFAAGAGAEASFGTSVALGGGRLAVGAPSVRGRGAAYVFQFFPNVRAATLKEPLESATRGPNPQGFGSSVAITADGNSVLVGRPQAGQGSSWLFARSSRGFLAQKPELTGGGSRFGRSVAISDSGAFALVGVSDTGVEVFGTVPLVSSVAPATGSTAGGTLVTITGRNFKGARVVTFGSKPAASFRVTPSGKIIAASPPASPGVVHVRVTNASGASRDQATGDRFRYAAPPQITAVSPASGPVAGGTQVRISGTNFIGPCPFCGVSAVTFGGRPAQTFSVMPNLITAVSPPRQAAGTVDLEVTTTFGTDKAFFTYLAAEAVVDFDDLVTGGLGQSHVIVRSQYAARGVTFNDLDAIDYPKGTPALTGFAHSGTVGIEPCIGVELCTTPIRGVFSASKRLVRVWVGVSGPLGQPVQVRLTALTGAGSIAGTATATLVASSTATPIRTPLEVKLETASIAQFEVAVPAGTNNGLAIDDVTFDSS